MDYVLVCTVSLVVAGLTFFSGFGLGTLLMPFFALFFDVPVAIAATAVVHLLNNLFKGGLMYKHADYKVVLRFAVPAAFMAFLGALLLTQLAEAEPLYTYEIFGRTAKVTVVKIIISIMIAGFSVFELHPRSDEMAFDIKYMPLGGAVSGFFGGLSGHQGALRSAFLIKAGLEKEAFVGTAVICAVVVDFARLIVYGSTFFVQHFDTIGAGGGWGLIAAGSLAAFLGSFLGRRLLEKVTMKTVQWIVAVMLFVLAAAMGTGII